MAGSLRLRHEKIDVLLRAMPRVVLPELKELIELCKREEGVCQADADAMAFVLQGIEENIDSGLTQRSGVQVQFVDEEKACSGILRMFKRFFGGQMVSAQAKAADDECLVSLQFHKTADGRSEWETSTSVPVEE